MPNRCKKRMESSAHIVESLDLASDESDELNLNTIETEHNIIAPSEIKKENDLLRMTIQNLNTRIGTEILEDDIVEDSVVVPRTVYPRNVNTLHYQHDHEFGKHIYYTYKRKLFSLIF